METNKQEVPSLIRIELKRIDFQRFSLGYSMAFSFYVLFLLFSNYPLAYSERPILRTSVLVFRVYSFPNSNHISLIGYIFAVYPFFQF